MIRILLTDTHFGWKQNSITWLNSQISFIDNQVIPIIKKYKSTGEEVCIIHLGDVFESRSSISPMIAKVVREKFIELRNLVDRFYIIAGNHDFYSPNSAEFDSLSMVFRECNIDIILDEIKIIGEDILIPWYQYKNDIDDILKDHPEIKNIYTHADIFGEDFKNTNLNIFSGHIHTPLFKNNLYNLGSCYALNFADCNQDRYFYIYDGKKLDKISNNNCIRFWRIYNEDIFEDTYGDEDYYELYINQVNMQNSKYQSRLTELTKKYKNIWIIPTTTSTISEDIEELESYNIEDICQKMIPDHLKNKFNRVLNYTI